MSKRIERFMNIQATHQSFDPDYRHPLSTAAGHLITSTELRDREVALAINRDFANMDQQAFNRDPSARYLYKSISSSTSILTWLSMAPPDHTSHFLQLYHERKDLLQKTLQKDSLDFNGATEAYYEILIQQNLYPSDVLQSLYKSFKEIPVRPMGSFDAHGKLGVFDGATIGVSNHYSDPVELRGLGPLAVTLLHERDHSLGQDLPLLLDEVTAGHNTAVAVSCASGHDGKPSIMDPLQRLQLRIDDDYFLERRLIGTIIEHANIPVHLFNEARIDGADSTAHNELAHRLTRGYRELAGSEADLAELLYTYEHAPTLAAREELIAAELIRVRHQEPPKHPVFSAAIA